MNLLRIRNLLRSLSRNKMVLATNVAGLSMGLAATILLVIFILHEWSYDRYFINADRIYRLNTIWINQGSQSVEPINLRKAFTEIPVEVPGIENTVQIYRGGDIELSSNDLRFANNRLLYVDSTFFRIFDFKPVQGNLRHALDDPASVVLTKGLATKIFGSTPAIGQTLTMNGKNYTVSAVMENVPLNTHFQFDLLMPMEAVAGLEHLGGLEFFTYYLLDHHVDQALTCSKICDANTNILKDNFKSFHFDFASEIQPLKRLHLYSRASYDLNRQGSIRAVILVGVIAFMVMFLALTNFVNLFIVEGELRSREIGVRKVNGAGRGSLVRQFFGETSMIVAVSFIIGLAVAVMLLPEFGHLMQREFSLSLLLSPMFLIVLPGVFLLTIFLSGSYPSFYLSGLKPASVLKPQTGIKNRKKYIMNLAGVLQLIITLFLLTVLFGINRQTRYLKNLSPGFNPDGLVNIYNLNDRMKSQYPAIRDKLLGIPEVIGVAASSHTIGGGTSGQGIRLVESPEDDLMSINEYRIQPGLCKLLQLKLVEGRFFDPERPTDRMGVILNEAALKELGLASAMGRKVVMFNKPMDVIGVVKNFRYESAAKVIKPLVLTDYSSDIWTIMVRMAPGVNTANVMKKTEQVLKSFDNGYIMNTSMTRDIYQHYYADEDKLSRLTTMGAILAVVIVMMGIFLLVSQSIARRTKEIGVRKALGGNTTRMIALIYSNSLKWTGIAAIVTIPLSYIYLHKWLQGYAVKAGMSWWLFFAGLVIVLLLETLITFVNTWRAASRNPVEALRYE